MSIPKSFLCQRNSQNCCPRGPENYINTNKMSASNGEHIFSSSSLNVLTCQRSTDVKALVIRKNNTLIQISQVCSHVIKSKLNLRQIETSHGYLCCLTLRFTSLIRDQLIFKSKIFKKFL